MSIVSCQAPLPLLKRSSGLKCRTERDEMLETIMDDLAKQIGAGLAMLQERKGDPLAPVPKVIMELTEELNATHGTSASPSPTAPCQLTTSYREKTLSAWQRKLVGIPERRRSQSSCTIDGDYQTEVIVDITSGKQVKVVKESLACVDPSDIMVSRDKLRRVWLLGPLAGGQALHPGAAQDRKRLVMIASAPRERLLPYNSIDSVTSAAQPGDDPHDLGHAHYFDPERAPYDAGRLAKTVTGGGGNFY
uniref:Uncharacterized protein n=1 Tax=Fusarium oxysporum (strain Fo5176) TaxID=660025 RepID=A0A0D2Y846_FUSOF